MCVKIVQSLSINSKNGDSQIIKHIDVAKKMLHNPINQKVNLKGDILVEITYTNNRVKKYFEDYNKMQKSYPLSG